LISDEGFLISAERFLISSEGWIFLGYSARQIKAESQKLRAES